MKKQIIISITVLLLISSCTSRSTDYSIVKLKEILLPLSAYPENDWEISGYVLPPVLPKYGAIDAYAVYYIKANNLSQHVVYEWRSRFQAFIFMRINNQVYFPTGSLTWTDVVNSEDWKLNGDEWRIRCATPKDEFFGDTCSAVIRYGRFITEFVAPISDELITYEEFENMVFEIDDKVNNYVQDQ